jgi:hypothetical protein
MTEIASATIYHTTYIMPPPSHSDLCPFSSFNYKLQNFM